MNVAECIVARLLAEGVEVIFTVPGEQHDPIFAALAGTEIRIVHARHEQTAAFMAYGYARSTQRVGVCLLLSGPGVLNATTAIATAYAGDARVLCLAAQIPTQYLDRNLGFPHEIPDQLGVLKSLTGWSTRVAEPAQIQPALAQAFHRLSTHRPRPVAVEIPIDVLAAEVTTSGDWSAPAISAGSDQALVAQARELLESAKAPIIFIGSGARGACVEVAELARLAQAPVTTELGGRGVLSDLDELALPLAAAHELWAQADVVLAIGTRLYRPQADWGMAGIKVVRIDLDPEEIHRVAAPAVALVGDAAVVLRQVLSGMRPRPDQAGWLARAARAREDCLAQAAELRPQFEYIQAMRAALPDDGFFVDEMTQVGYVARLAFPVTQPSTYVLATYVGALGFGFATALGVKLAHPERAVLSISGDGGFLYTCGDLATAVQHRIGVVAVVFNDGCFTNVKRSQQKFLHPTIATELHNPNFVQLAESFGAVGVRAEGPQELGQEIEQALARSDLPTLIEVPLGETANPWPLIRLPRVR